MIFTGLNILYYFLNRNRIGQDIAFFEHEKFVKGHYFVKEANASADKNYTFKVYELDEKDKKDKPIFFVKQAKKFDSVNLLDLDTEVRALDILNRKDSLLEYIPTLIDADFNNGFIATNYVDGNSLRNYLTKNHQYIGVIKEEEAHISHIFKKMAHLMAELHNLPYKEDFAEYSPMLFQLNEEFLDNLSKISKLENSEIVSKNIPNQQIIDNLKAIIPFIKQIDYKKNALIHRDVHFNNFIYNQTSNTSELKLIDWELTSFGDKYWDIARIFSSLLDIGTNRIEKKQLFISQIIKHFWRDYHFNSKKIITSRKILKVINFITCEKLLRQLELMLSGEKIDADKISEILTCFNNPKSVVINYINLYDELTKA